MTDYILVHYSGDLKSELFEDRISNGRALAMAIVIVPTIQNPYHSKSGSFATQTLFDHSKSRLGRISHPHCIRIYTLTLSLVKLIDTLSKCRSL